MKISGGTGKKKSVPFLSYSSDNIHFAGIAPLIGSLSLLLHVSRDTLCPPNIEENTVHKIGLNRIAFRSVQAVFSTYSRFGDRPEIGFE